MLRGATDLPGLGAAGARCAARHPARCRLLEPPSFWKRIFALSQPKAAPQGPGALPERARRRGQNRGRLRQRGAPPPPPPPPAAPPRGRGSRRGSPPHPPSSPAPGATRPPGGPPPALAHIAAGGRRPDLPDGAGRGGWYSDSSPFPRTPLYLLPPGMALALAGEPGPATDATDALGLSPAGLAAYYPPFLPPAQYLEAPPDFFQPLGRLLPPSPPLPPFGIPAFLSLPPPPSAPPPLAQAPADAPQRAARPGGGCETAGQSRRFHFSEEELNAVLYGALRSPQLPGGLHAISGLRVPPASPGRGTGNPGRGGRGIGGRPHGPSEPLTRVPLRRCRSLPTGSAARRGRAAAARRYGPGHRPPPRPAPCLRPRSARAVPAGLAVLRVAYGDVWHLGVFCTAPIPKGVRFGPFQGKVVNTTEIKTYDDNSLMWEVAAAGGAGWGDGGGGGAPPRRCVTAAG